MLKGIFICILGMLPLLGSADAVTDIRDCSNVGNTININECSKGVATREEARMQQELSGLIAVLQRKEKFFAAEKANFVAPLQVAQDAWALYRDQQCAFVVALVMGGTMEEMYRLRCLASLHEDRANQLKTERQEHEAEGY